MDAEEVGKLQKFLQIKFGNAGLEVRARPRKADSCEVYSNDEFIGIIYLDDEDGDRSYNFQMAILDIDLEELE